MSTLADRQLIAQRLSSKVVELASFTSVDWRRLDRLMRERSQWTSPDWLPEWSKIRPFEVEGIAHASGHAEEAAAILGMHSNGYVREEAVKVMAALGGPLPGLLLRCSDWVAPVSQRAQAAVNDLRMHTDSADAFRSWLPLLNPNGHAVRHAAFLAETYAGVIGGSTPSDLIASLRSPDPGVRQAAARALSNRGDAIAALDVALGDCDPLVSRIIIDGVRPDDMASPTVVFSDLEQASRQLRERVHSFIFVARTSLSRPTIWR